MQVPEDLRYTQDHEWLRVDGDEATVGITEYAAGELGDVVFVELPATGMALDSAQSFGVIESVKTARMSLRLSRMRMASSASVAAMAWNPASSTMAMAFMRMRPSSSTTSTTGLRPGTARPIENTST